MYFLINHMPNYRRPSRSEQGWDGVMEMGNALAVEEKVTVRDVNCSVSPSLFLLNYCPEEEAGKQQKQ